VKAGLANAKRRGRTVGRPRVVVNVQDVFQRASQGVSGREIAKVARVSEATVRRILRSTTVEGDAVRRPVGLNPL
jgi:DNA invertase Pin-like site-specific DNA recombinase